MEQTTEHSVTNVQDKTIGKRVLNIAGSVSAAHWVMFPRQRTQNLGLTGQFLYLQVIADNTVDNYYEQYDGM